MEQIDVGGLRIAYERSGHGPPIVLLHGFLTDSRVWHPQLEGLSDDHTVVAWDAPGCGRSSDPPETFRMPDYADCLAAFIEALELDRPHVLGLSFGSALALELYRRHPTVPRSLLLVSAYAGWAGSLPPDMVAERLRVCLEESVLPPERFVPRWIPDLINGHLPAETIDEVVAIMSEFHPAGYRAMVRSLAEADLRDVLSHIEVPTLLLYGDADRRSPPRVGEELRARIPGSTLAVLPGAGHLCNVDAAEPFTDEVRAFLRSQPRGA